MMTFFLLVIYHFLKKFLLCIFIYLSLCLLFYIFHKILHLIIGSKRGVYSILIIRGACPGFLPESTCTPMHVLRRLASKCAKRTRQSTCHVVHDPKDCDITNAFNCFRPKSYLNWQLIELFNSTIIIPSTLSGQRA